MIPEVVRPSRRAVLGVAAAGVLTGCSSDGTAFDAARARPAPPAPGSAERARAAADGLDLLRRYDAAATAHPDLAARLAPLRSEVARHVAALGATPPAAQASPTASAPPSASAPAADSAVSGPPAPASAAARDSSAPPSAPSSGTTATAQGRGRRTAGASPSAAPAPAVPATSAATLAWLRAAERALADRRATALLTVPGDLARLLASTAAADAGHVVLLAPTPPARTGISLDADLTPGPSRSPAASSRPAGSVPTASGRPAGAGSGTGRDTAPDAGAGGAYGTGRDTDSGASAGSGPVTSPAAGAGTGSGRGGRTVLAAAQAALAAEHAAVYGYGAVGGRVGAGREPEAREAYAAHRAARDALIRTVSGLGGTPVAAAAAYALPFAVPDRAAAVRLAAYLEERVAGACGDLVRAGAGAVRRDAAAGLRAAAVRAVRWSGGSVAFPGLAERR